MYSEHINFYVLGRKAGRRIQVLEWSPVEVELTHDRNDDRTTRIKWWAEELAKNLEDEAPCLPDGLFAAYVHQWWRQGFEDGDGGAKVLAAVPVESMAWRHTWGPLRIQAEEDAYRQAKAEEAYWASYDYEGEAARWAARA